MPIVYIEAGERYPDFNIIEDEDFARKFGFEPVSFTEQELARIKAAIDEYAAVQKLLGKREPNPE